MGRRGLTYIVIVLSLVACRRYVFQQQAEGIVEASKKEVTINVPSESDILFVLDNSGSMAEEIDPMRCSIQGFVEALSATENKFRVAVTTTDNQDDTGGNCDNPPGVSASVDLANKRHGRCGHFLAPAGKPGFLKREDFGTPHAMAVEFTNYLKRDNSTITTGGSPVEQPLKSAFNALDPLLAMPGGPNEGFFRKDALLVIVFVTDESDCSYDDDKAAVFATVTARMTPGTVFGHSCYSQRDQLVAPAVWANRIIQRKGGDKTLVRVGLISSSVKDGNGTLQPASCRISDVGGQSVATDDCACFYLNPVSQPQSYCNFTKLKTPSLTSGNACGQQAMSTTPTNACPAPQANAALEGNCCIALANDRMFAFTNTFENLKDTICQRDFSQTLLALANLADRQCFSLEKAPLDNDPNNVELKMRRLGEARFDVIPLTGSAIEERGDGWYYENNGTPTACLNGIWKRKTGDTISLFVVSGVSGSTDTVAQ